MNKVIGLDLGGTKVNVTATDGKQFLIHQMHEIPSLVTQGPEVCSEQLQAAYELGLALTGWKHEEVTAVGLDTPGPASAEGVFNDVGPTNFKHPAYGNFDIRAALQHQLGKPVSYLNDGNAAALYAHWDKYSTDPAKSSVSLIIGTGLGGGIVIGGRPVIGRVGFAAELGHTYLPGDWNPFETIEARCNCGRRNDLESIASLTGIELNLLPHYIRRHPGHPLYNTPAKEAAKQIRSLAEAKDPLALKIFETQTWAIAGHIDQMINIIDPDSVFIGGGGVEANQEFRDWFLANIRANIRFRKEQADLPIEIVPHGDMAGARGAALYALALFPS